ncbi:MAG: YtxH domain-containing protein [Cyclobacteriaceae bacterium]|nr:YtxH domain-containing protein [Cyclobacteriaceae bacterium]
MDAKNLIGGLLAGAAIGVAIGILLAPKSGAETREDISKGSRKLSDNLKGTFDDSIDMLKEKFNSGVDEATRRTKEVVNGANEKLKA